MINAKTAKTLRKYAKDKTNSQEDAKLAYRQLKAEFKVWRQQNGT